MATVTTPTKNYTRIYRREGLMGLKHGDTAEAESEGVSGQFTVYWNGHAPEGANPMDRWLTREEFQAVPVPVSGRSRIRFKGDRLF